MINRQYYIEAWGSQAVECVAAAPPASNRSCSSIVSHKGIPLVSGKQRTKNPHGIMAIPKTPYDHSSFFLPSHIRIGSNTDPKMAACLTNDVAQFLTQVGNNSIMYISNML
uniref:Uncharacterized protein n=1 Tax=Opuntia streptacantha TaxID=393608 RepID=A0A7C8YX23_OPUST